MMLLLTLFPLICSSVIVNKAFQIARFLPSKISYDDASKSLQKWAESNAAQTASTALRSVAEEIDLNGVGLRAADYLIGRWFSTKSKANSACKHGNILVNGKRVYASRILSLGDLLEIDFTEKVVPAKSAESIILNEIEVASELHKLVNYTNHILDERRYPPLHILYEDNHLAVVYKPSGIHSMKWVGTMKKKLFALDDILPLVLIPPEIIHNENSVYSDSMNRPLPCHRLDARVSGCLIVAKTQRAMSDLSKQFEHRFVEKEYRAILAGNLTKILEIDFDITKTSIIEWDSMGQVSDANPHSTSFPVYSVGDVEKGRDNQRIGRVADPIDGFDALTEIKILEITPCSVYGALTTVSLFPHTGRRHQLRRHCAILGCPIIGDDLYHDAGMLPASRRHSAVAALSVGKTKIVSKSILRVDGDEDGDEDEEMSLDISLDNTSKCKDDSNKAKDPENVIVNVSGSLERIKMTDKQLMSLTPSVNLNMELVDKMKGVEIIKSPEGVRKKVGIFLMCTAVEFYHPVDTVSGDPTTDLMISVGTKASEKEKRTGEEEERKADMEGERFTAIEKQKEELKHVSISSELTQSPQLNKLQSQSQLEQLEQLQSSIQDRIKVIVRCDESPRFVRLREKALKGYEWQLAQQSRL